MTLRLLGIALSVCTTLLVVGCEDEITPGKLPSAPQPIVFGVSLGRTGSSAASAQAITTAVKVAEAQINALGGIEGRPVVYEFYDDLDKDGQTLQTGVQSALLDKGAIAILGPIRSGQMLALAEITAGVVPIISPSATSVSLVELPDNTRNWVFRTIPSDDVQAKAMVRFARNGVAGQGGNCSKLAIAYEDDAYGQKFAETLDPAWRAAGGTVVKTTALTGDSNFEQVVEEFSAADPDCITLVSVEDVGGAFARAFAAKRDSDPTAFRQGVFVVAADGLYNDGFLVQSRTDAADPATSKSNGFFGTTAQPNSRSDPAWNEYMQLHRQLAPGAKELSAYVAGAYDAAILLALGRAAAASDDPELLREAINQVSKPPGDQYSPKTVGDALLAAAEGGGDEINYVGASGPVDFNAANDVTAPFLVWRVDNSTFVEVGGYKAEELQ